MRRRLLAAAAVLVMSAAGAMTATAAPARAATPQHVAIVVAGVGSACVSAGGSGLGLLASAFAVTVGQQTPYVGFVLTIGGTGTNRPDNTHYWAYFHDTGGGWQYSNTGGASYRPQAGTVEGWSYVDGQQTAPPPPAASYAAICAGQDPQPAPAPAPKPSPHARSSTVPPRAAAASTHLPAAAASTHLPAATSDAPTPSTSVTASPSASGTRAASSGQTSPQPTAAVTSAGAAPAAPHRSAVPPAGTAIGLLVVMLLGTLAYRRARRDRLGGA